MAATKAASSCTRISNGAPCCLRGLSLAQVATRGYKLSRPSSRARWPQVGGSALVPSRAMAAMARGRAACAGGLAEFLLGWRGQGPIRPTIGG